VTGAGAARAAVADGGGCAEAGPEAEGLGAA
jgi:hypothetical protein